MIVIVIVNVLNGYSSVVHLRLHFHVHLHKHLQTLQWKKNVFDQVVDFSSIELCSKNDRFSGEI